MRRTLLVVGAALIAVGALAAPAGAVLDPEPLTTWGSSGTGDGQFQIATGVGVDAEGRIFVGDDFGHRVQKFAPDTSFLTEFGTGVPASLDRPYGIEVDTKRKRVWVASSNNNKIVAFKQNGAFVRSVSGDGPVTLFVPYDVAVDPKNGDVYVVEIFAERVVRFSKNGVYKDDWPVTGVDAPRLKGIVIDPKNRDVYVTDDANDRVVVYTRQGDFVREWDTWTGGSVLTFEDPWGITASKRRIYVGDNDAGLVFEFTRAGVYQAETDGGTQPFTNPVGMSLTRNGSKLFVAGGGQNKVYKFRT
ncbi:MAG: hypothetical protein ACRDWD_06215 [Acidimicrobiia bacterium]